MNWTTVETERLVKLAARYTKHPERGLRPAKSVARDMDLSLQAVVSAARRYNVSLRAVRERRGRRVAIASTEAQEELARDLEELGVDTSGVLREISGRIFGEYGACPSCTSGYVIPNTPAGRAGLCDACYETHLAEQYEIELQRVRAERYHDMVKQRDSRARRAAGIAAPRRRRMRDCPRCGKRIPADATDCTCGWHT